MERYHNICGWKGTKSVRSIQSKKCVVVKCAKSIIFILKLASKGAGLGLFSSIKVNFLENFSIIVVCRFLSVNQRICRHHRTMLELLWPSLIAHSWKSTLVIVLLKILTILVNK